MVNVNVNGRLGADAEVLDGKKGKFVSFRIAVSDFVGGEKATTWMRVTYDGERAIKVSPFLKKGSLVTVVGTEGVRKYTDKNGEVQISRDISAMSVDFISVGSGATQTTTDPHENIDMGKLKEPSTSKKTKASIAEPTPTVAEEDDADDLPF